MIVFGFIMIVWALVATVSAGPDRLPSQLLGLYWIASYAGQLFSFPISLLAIVAAMAARGAGLILLIIAASLFAFTHWRNRRAARVLLDGVGLNNVKVPPLAGLLPLATGADKVRRLSSISYDEANASNSLDLVLPRLTTSAPMPVLMQVHGGSWTYGAKNQQAKPLIHYLAAQGWLCVDINYRLGPAHRCPAMITDVLKAIAWVKSQIHEYGGDPRRIAITGGSAGAHLAALAALAHDDPLLKPGFEGIDCRVEAAVPLYGRYDFLDRKRRLKRNHEAVINGFMARRVMPGTPDECPQLWQDMSPIDRTRSDAPPIMLVHGTGDTMLPCSDARDFADAACQASTSPVIYIELTGIQHAFDTGNSAATWGLTRAVAAFLEPLKNQTPASTAVPQDEPQPP